jgi:hypothetical protein
METIVYFFIQCPKKRFHCDIRPLSWIFRNTSNEAFIQLLCWKLCVSWIHCNWWTVLQLLVLLQMCNAQCHLTTYNNLWKLMNIVEWSYPFSNFYGEHSLNEVSHTVIVSRWFNSQNRDKYIGISVYNVVYPIDCIYRIFSWYCELLTWVLIQYDDVYIMFHAKTNCKLNTWKHTHVNCCPGLSSQINLCFLSNLVVLEV